MERRLGIRILAVPVVAAALTAGAGIGGYVLTRADAVDRDRHAFLGAIPPAATTFANAIDDAVDVDAEFRFATGTDQGVDAAAVRAGLDALVRVTHSGTAPVAATVAAIAEHGIVLAAPDAATPALASTFETARDTGKRRATPPLRLAGTSNGAVLVVFPRYPAGVAIDTTAARRAAIESYTVGVLRPAGTAAAALGPLADRGGSVEVRDGADRIFHSGGDVTTTPVRSRLEVGGRQWTITTWPPEGEAGVVPAVVLIAGLLIAAAVLASGRQAYVAEQRAAAEARDRDYDLQAVATIGPLLQQSLDLAEVLPAATAYLAERFDLDGVSVAHVGDDGYLVEAFTIGRRLIGIPRVATELRSPPDQLAAGEVATIPLLRGGRVIGVIHALGGRELTPERTRTLVAVAEMVGTALANARQFEQEQEAVRRLTELDRLKTDFLGTVSHELQTPITAILGFSSMLDEQFDDLTPDERRDFITRIARNAGSLSTLVRELLDFSRIGRHHYELHPQDIDLTEVTTRIVDQFAGLVGRHRVVIDAPTAVWALADPEAVERVVANLLSNAAKYSPSGSVISVMLDHDADHARIVVDDTGPGVSEEDRPHVFRRFYRGNSPAAVATRGAGIGLAVVKDLVERMHGSVGVDAAPGGGGARFIVSLPLRPGGPVHPSPPSEAAGQGRVP